MDWYSAAKLLHIVFAMVWFGGGMAMIVLGWSALRSRDDGAFVHVVRQVVFLAERVFVPASLLTLVFGIVMAWLVHGFRDLWIILGLVGFAATFMTGVFVIKPMAERVAATKAVTPETPALCRRIIETSSFDYVVIFLVIAVMVLKPTAADVAVLGAMAAILAASGLWFIATLRRPLPA